MITWDGAMGGDDAKGFLGEDVAYLFNMGGSEIMKG